MNRQIKLEVSLSANNLDNVIPSKKITLYSFRGLEETLDQKTFPHKILKKLSSVTKRFNPSGSVLPPIKADLSIDAKSPLLTKVPRITPK